MDYQKIMRRMFFSGYLRVIVLLSNILINMINYYDKKNVLTFKRTQTRIVSIDIKEEKDY